MKKVLSIILISLFSFTVISCSSSSDDGASTTSDNTTTSDDDETTTDNDSTTTPDTTAPVIAEVTFVTTPNNDTTPDYTFSSNEAGTITYGGSCSSSTTSATSGNNTITLVSLSEDTYSDCTIKVTDSSGNVSNTLTITSFIVDTTAATLVEVTAVTTPTNDTTPDYTFSSSEAGTITYPGSCSSDNTTATTDNNTITLNSLSDGTHSNCAITVTDNASNGVTLNISSFVIDTTAPTVSSVSSSTDNDSYKINGNITVTVTFNENVIVDNSSGNPRIQLETGTNDRYANYVSGNSTSILSFLYTVQSGDNTTDLDYTSTSSLSANNGTIQDNATNNANLTLLAPGSSGSLGANKDIVVDTTAPTVSSVSTTADNQSSVSITDNITVTFSEAMDITYVTTNTDNTSCSGTLRVSSDNFSNCVQMASSPSSSNSDKTFTLDPSDNLTGGTTYLTRVTTGVKDAAGNAMGSQYDNSTGFTTTSSSTQMGGSIQGNALSLSTAVTTLAGSTSGTFNNPRGITTDGTNLYVADSDNNRIRKIVISTGAVTTLASIAGNPQGITTDGTNLYVTTYRGHRIYKIVISTEAVTTLAESTSGNLDNIIGITTDGTNLYVSKFLSHKIQKIVIDNGTVTTFAGNSSGTFNRPWGITTDGTNLYVSDVNNHRIRKIVISTGVVTTLVGTAGSYGSTDTADGTPSFKYPRGITTDGTNLYVADTNNHRIRKIVISTGSVTTLAGSSDGYTDHTTGILAKFDSPIGITTDGTNLYVGDSENHRIRKIE